MNNQIVILKGAERVRRRPAVIFGDDGIDGAMTAFEMILNTLLTEGVNGFSKKIIITQFRDDSIGLQDFDRGIFLGSAGHTDDTIWRNLFCELYAGSAYPAADEQPRSIFEAPCGGNAQITDSFELCAVQYASEYMDVCVHRDGLQYRLHFEKGENWGGLTKIHSAEASGTHIRFKPDPAVFSEISLPAQWLSDKAKTLAMLIPGMQVIFRRETAEGFDEVVFCYPAGIADYLMEQSQRQDISPIYTAELEAEGQERYNRPRYSAKVKVGLLFTEEPGFIECYHNQRELTYGGTHADKLISEICRYLEWTIGHSVTKEELLAHLRLVVVSNASITCWVNGTRRSIENSLIRDMAQDTLGEAFRQYAKENKAFIRSIYCQKAT